jgi:hypothetical protein
VRSEFLNSSIAPLRYYIAMCNDQANLMLAENGMHNSFREIAISVIAAL